MSQLYVYACLRCRTLYLVSGHPNESEVRGPTTLTAMVASHQGPGATAVDVEATCSASWCPRTRHPSELSHNSSGLLLCRTFERVHLAPPLGDLLEATFRLGGFDAVHDSLTYRPMEWVTRA